MSEPDIVDELRSINTWLISVDAMARAEWIAKRAAAEIERLRAELTSLSP
jgi:hypothetical protein